MQVVEDDGGDGSLGIFVSLERMWKTLGGKRTGGYLGRWGGNGGGNGAEGFIQELSLNLYVSRKCLCMEQDVCTVLYSSELLRFKDDVCARFSTLIMPYPSFITLLPSMTLIQTLLIFLLAAEEHDRLHPSIYLNGWMRPFCCIPTHP